MRVDGKQVMLGREWPRVSRCVGLLLGVLCGACDQAAENGATEAVPRAAHPAMHAQVQENLGLGQMPPGHPPVTSTQPSGAPPTSAAGGAATAESILARLHEFGLTTTFDPGWRLEAGTSMRLATIRLPRVDGDADDGEMSIIPARGSIDDNIRRWEGQFSDQPTAQRSDVQSSAGVNVTVVEIEGTFNPSTGPMMRGTSTPKPGTMLLGAVVQSPGRADLVFFKAWGPKNTMQKWRPSFEAMVQAFAPAR